MQNTPNITTRAMQFAYSAHDGQLRDDGITPFIAHPAKVAQIISQVTTDENMIAAAWLHDTLEDTDITHADLVREFNQDIADLVQEVTKMENTTLKIFPNLKTQRGIVLKFADRLSNISDMDSWSDKRKQKYLDKSRFW